MKKIHILGTGCAKCNDLEVNAKQAVEELGADFEFVKVTNLNDIMTFGCMTTPGLVIDGQLVAQGKLLKPEQIKKLIAG